MSKYTDQLKRDLAEPWLRNLAQMFFYGKDVDSNGTDGTKESFSGLPPYTEETRLKLLKRTKSTK